MPADPARARDPDPADPLRLPLLATASVILIFGALVAAAAWQVRRVLRAQVLAREGEALHSVALLELSAQRATDPTALLAAVLESSRLRGVMAIRLYDADGVLRDSLPAVAGDAPLDAAMLARMRADRPHVVYVPRGSVDEMLGLPAGATGAPPAPMLLATVPLRRAGSPVLLGAARYWIAAGEQPGGGTGIAAELRRLDHQMEALAAVAFGCGSLLIAVILAAAFRRLDAAHRRLQAQTEDLVRANRELTFAAKTSALGAISAHLIHDLKNPLAGLDGFVREAGSEAAGPAGEAWRDAAQTTQRVRAVIAEISELLHDEAAGEFVPLTPDEVVAEAVRRSQARATASGIDLIAVPSGAGQPVPGRPAHLSLLVLRNLIDNACKVAPRGTSVAVSSHPEADGASFLVTDHGPGVPAAIRQELFQPKSGRGPDGLGLAISHQLARHAGGVLDLLRSGPEGTQFRLRLTYGKDVSSRRGTGPD